MCLLLAQRRLLGIALGRAAPAQIPRSGDEGKAVNYYLTRVHRKTGHPLVIESADGNMLNCLEFDGDRYAIQTKHEFESLLKEKFEFKHYHGLATTTYSGWLDFALGWIFKGPYIKAWFYFKRADFLQSIYNRKKLVTKQRIDLLKVILDTQLNGTDRLCSLSIMTLIHTDMWYLHPKGDEHLHRMEFYLNALSETNLLARSGTDYSITGQGIDAIERYEEEERKHSENIGSQRRMFWLTIVIAALTLVQAGLVKLPPFLDFTK
jgi:hypothetical protein